MGLRTLVRNVLARLLLGNPWHVVEYHWMDPYARRALDDSGIPYQRLAAPTPGVVALLTNGGSASRRRDKPRPQWRVYWPKDLAWRSSLHRRLVQLPTGVYLHSHLGGTYHNLLSVDPSDTVYHDDVEAARRVQALRAHWLEKFHQGAQQGQREGREAANL